MMKFKKSIQTQPSSYRVLGIDPGYERIGVAVVEKNEGGKEIVLFSDCIITKRENTHAERLKVLGDAVLSVIDEYKPTHTAIEKLYFNQNQKTALQVAEARGVLLYLSSQHNIPIFEYTPLEIKSATTGYGKAEKKQMIAMVERLVVLKKQIRLDDEYDAIAIALTCLAREKVAFLARYPQPSPPPLAKSLIFDTNRKSKKGPRGHNGLKD